MIGLQETAVRVGSLGLEPRTIDVDLIALAYRVPAGHHIDLHVSTSSFGMGEHRGAAAIDIAITVDVPVRAADTSPPPSPTPTPTGSPTGPPGPGDAPGTPQVLPATLVSGFGRVPHADAPNTFVAFAVVAGRTPDGMTWGSFVVRDPILNGARATWRGVVHSLELAGDTAILSGSCDVAGDPDAGCSLTLKDGATPGAGSDRAWFEAAGYVEGGTIPLGEVLIQTG